MQGLVDGVPTTFLLVDNTEEFRFVPKTIQLGDAVFVIPNGKIAKASAFVPDQVCIGIVIDFNPQREAIVLVQGLARDVLSDLVPGATYYLSIEAGKITSDPPREVGHRVQHLGVALSTTDFLLQPDQRRIFNRTHNGYQGPQVLAWEPETLGYGLYPLPGR